MTGFDEVTDKKRPLIDPLCDITLVITKIYKFFETLISKNIIVTAHYGTFWHLGEIISITQAQNSVKSTDNTFRFDISCF